MSQVLSIARKELRAYFLSPVALIFIGTFLAVTVFTFFWVETFFARGIADIRPLFAWMPVLLIFLVSALTMKLWSEEQKLGTLETLLTLPVSVPRLVLGKFVAGMGLVLLALGLTIGVPITVSFMGDLDWGPVVGGYVGALLLAAAYLAIGLCISASTDNPIVSLIGTAAAGGGLYVLGTSSVSTFAGDRVGDLLRALGSGSRFESIQRGVIDVRDVVYYASLTAFFLFLNVLLLESKRWSNGLATKPRRLNAKLMAVLLGANLVALNVWLASVARVRVDVTQQREYSVSPVTRDLLRSLDDPLIVRGYFSSKTHPLLAPLIPRIRDLIAEYGVISRGRVRAEIVDPTQDESVEKEANQMYGIRSFPFRVAGRYESAIVNSYFSILVKYGDQYEVLNFSDLIDVQVNGENIDVRLRNLEYDLTRAVKKVVYGFQSVDSLFASLPAAAELTAYVSEKTLPDNFKEAPGHVRTVLKDLESRSGGKLKWSVVDPDGEGAAPGIKDSLLQQYGIRPFQASLFSPQTFYFHLILRSGQKVERIVPNGQALTEADLRKQIEAALKRVTPGFLKTVGVVKPEAPQMPPQYQQYQQPQRPDFNRQLGHALSETYEIRDVALTSGEVPGDIDVLLLVEPKNLGEKERFAVDQYLMRGGSVIVLGGRYALQRGGMAEGLHVEKVTSGLEDLLETYGVSMEDAMVLDPQNEAFPIPVVRDLGFARVREIQQIRYPFFVDVRRDGMGKDNPITSGLPQVTLQWASPMTVKPAQGREAVELVHSTKQSWKSTSLDIQPDFNRYREFGFEPGAERKPQVLAVSVKGVFDSAFANKPSPLFGADEKDAPANADRTGRTIKKSPETARLVVVGSSAFVDDQIIGLSQQVGRENTANGLHLVQNLIDWCVQDVDLLSIRSRSTFARTLLPMDTGKRAAWEWSNYGVVILSLVGIAGVAAYRRRRLRPIDLDPPSARAAQASKEEAA
jgi:ABC-2 type transport system permease protein